MVKGIKAHTNISSFKQDLASLAQTGMLNGRKVTKKNQNKFLVLNQQLINSHKEDQDLQSNVKTLQGRVQMGQADASMEGITPISSSEESSETAIPAEVLQAQLQDEVPPQELVEPSTTTAPSPAPDSKVTLPSHVPPIISYSTTEVLQDVIKKETDSNIKIKPQENKKINKKGQKDLHKLKNWKIASNACIMIAKASAYLLPVLLATAIFFPPALLVVGVIALASISITTISLIASTAIRFSIKERDEISAMMSNEIKFMYIIEQKNDSKIQKSLEKGIKRRKEILKKKQDKLKKTEGADHIYAPLHEEQKEKVEIAQKNLDDYEKALEEFNASLEFYS